MSVGSSAELEDVGVCVGSLGGAEVGVEVAGGEVSDDAGPDGVVADGVAVVGDALVGGDGILGVGGTSGDVGVGVFDEASVGFGWLDVGVGPSSVSVPDFVAPQATLSHVARPMAKPRLARVGASTARLGKATHVGEFMCAVCASSEHRSAATGSYFRNVPFDGAVAPFDRGAAVCL